MQLLFFFFFFVLFGEGGIDLLLCHCVGYGEKVNAVFWG